MDPSASGREPAPAERRFSAALDSLPAREREIAVLLYVKNLTLREVGDLLEIPESRVSELHMQLKRALKQFLAGQQPAFGPAA